MVSSNGQSSPLRVALTGAGMISWYHLAAWRNLRERVRVVALCDPNLQRAQRRAEEFLVPSVYSDAKTMLANEAIDALDVASPRETHAAWIEAAAANGIDVLCQKPLTPTLADAEALIQRIDGKIRLMVHENWRFRPWYRELKRWIAAGELGEILMGQLTTIDSGLLPDVDGRRWALERQPFMANEARLMISEALIHHLDVMRFLCGPLRVLSARAARTLADVKGETLAMIFLETETGAPLVVGGAMAAPGYSPSTADRLEIVGGRASAFLTGAELHFLGPKSRRERFDLAGGYQTSFDSVIAHFVDCLETRAPFETGPMDNLETLRLVEQAYLAAGLQ